MGEITYAEWDASRAAEVRALLDACFDSNPKAEPGILEWQYWSGPFGQGHSFVALDGPRLVGHIGSYRVPLELDGRSVPAAVVVDAAVHPDYRGRRIYGQLGERVRDASRADGCVLAFSTPNELALPTAKRVGWADLAERRLFVRPVTADWLARSGKAPQVVARAARVVFPVARPSTAERIPGAPRDLDALAASVWDGGLSGIRPSLEWWRWRFSKHPQGVYRFYEYRNSSRLEAALVVRSNEEAGTIVIQVLDLVAVSRLAARAVVDAAILDSPRAEGVTALATPDGPHATALRWGGLRAVPLRFRGRTAFLAYPFTTTAESLRAARWSFNGGSLDFT